MPHPVALPPWKLPLMATLAVAACIAVLALQVLGHPGAIHQRSVLLACFLAAALPLTALQRTMWRRGAGGGVTAAALLLASGVLALLGNLALAAVTRPAAPLAELLAWSTLLRGRALDGLWPVLLIQAALHAALNYAWAGRAERERALLAETLAREAELRALRWQLQPHFLFNTLNAISALVAGGRGRDACDLIGLLADHLRGSLVADARHQVPLAEELAHAADYLAIEQRRLGERLRVRQHVEPALLGTSAPRWLLQPLLENAVQHGIAARPDGGQLELKVQRSGDAVELVLTNDRPALPSATALAGSGHGVGLQNVAARLSALYPGRHAFESGAIEGGGWRVRVRWPLEPVVMP